MTFDVLDDCVAFPYTFSNVTTYASALNGVHTADLIFHSGVYVDGYDIDELGPVSSSIVDTEIGGVDCPSVYEVTIPLGDVFVGYRTYDGCYAGTLAPIDNEDFWLRDTYVRFRIYVKFPDTSGDCLYVIVTCVDYLTDLGVTPADPSETPMFYAHGTGCGSIFWSLKEWFCECETPYELLTLTGAFEGLTCYSNTDSHDVTTFGGTIYLTNRSGWVRHQHPTGTNPFLAQPQPTYTDMTGIVESSCTRVSSAEEVSE